MCSESLFSFLISIKRTTEYYNDICARDLRVKFSGLDRDKPLFSRHLRKANLDPNYPLLSILTRIERRRNELSSPRGNQPKTRNNANVDKKMASPFSGEGIDLQIFHDSKKIAISLINQN